MSLRDFLVGTAVGIVPGTVGYAALGASAGRSAAIVAGSLALGTVLFVGSIVVGAADGAAVTEVTAAPPVRHFGDDAATGWLATNSSCGSTAARTARSRSQASAP